MAQELNEILIRINVQTDTAETAMNKVTAGMAVWEKTTGNALAKATRSTDAFSRKIEAAAKAQETLIRNRNAVVASLKIGDITQQQSNALLEQAEDAYQRASVGADKYALASTRGMNSSRMMGTAVQQAGYQVGDFAVQVASGQSAVRAFIQQGTQLVSMFGPTGAVIGAIGAIGGAIYMAFNAGEEAVVSHVEKLKEVTKEIGNISKAYQDAADKAKGLDPKLAAQRTGLQSTEIELDRERKFLTEIRRTKETASAYTMLGRAEISLAIIRENMALKRIAILETSRKKQIELLRLTGKTVKETERLNEKPALDKKANQERQKFFQFVADQRYKEQEEFAKRAKKLREQSDKEERDEAIERQKFFKWIDDQRFKEKEIARKADDKRVKEMQKNSEKAAADIQKALGKAAKESAKVWDKQFDKMGDALSDFVETGKMDFASLTRSILSDMLKMQIQSQITGPLAALGKQMISSLFTSVSPTGSDVGYGTPFAEGGPVVGPGSGTSDSILASLSNGEFVVNAKSAARHRGLLEALNSGQVPKRFAAGGMASSTPVTGGGGTVVNVIDQRSGEAAPIETSQSTRSDGRREIAVFVRDTVRRQIAGGEHDSAMRNRFGARPIITQRG